MAATRLISLHVNKGKSVAKCLADRTDYSENEKKTNGGEFISSYACDPKTCDQEFLLSKREYLHTHGSEPKGNVIAYQIRQSFKPGEVTPEEANKVGYETAMRWTKGEHAFIVATHVDRAHIHNHIIYNSTTIAGDRKWRDFLRSGKALQKVSDLVCAEHGLSVITPRPYKDRPKYRNPAFKVSHERDFKLVLDIEQIIKKNKGENYEKWAKRYNMKQVAKSLCFIKEHGINTIEELIELTDKSTKRFDELSDSLKDKQRRLEEISELKTHIANYAKTRETYAEYRQHGYSKKFFEAHREALLLHKAAKEFFNSHGITKLPKMKELTAEYDRILTEKKKDYAEYKEIKVSMKDYLIARQNLEPVLKQHDEIGRSSKSETLRI